MTPLWIKQSRLALKFKPNVWKPNIHWKWTDPFEIQTQKCSVCQTERSVIGRSLYLEKASVTHRLYPFPEEVVFSGPNRSMCTLWFGSLHWGKGVKTVVAGLLSFLVFWHLITCWDVIFNLAVHARPPVRCQNSFFGFVYTFGTSH